MDCNDSEKITQECYNKLYKSSGCTVPVQSVKQVYPNNTSVKKVKDDLAKITNSNDAKDLKKCYGESTESGYGSRLPYFSDNTSNCSSGLKDTGDIIKCEKCEEQLGRSEGIWLYKDGNRIWIPDCTCPTAMIAANVKVTDDWAGDICGNSYSQWKPVETIQDECAIYDAWNNPDTNWYYEGKGLGSNDGEGIKSDETIFYTTPSTIYKIHGKCQVQCQGNSINICDKTRVKSCKDPGSNCNQDCTITVKNPTQPKNLDPKCFYSIPVSNAGGPTRNYKVGDADITISGMNCQNPYFLHAGGLDAIAYLNNPTGSCPGPVYVFCRDQYFALNTSGDGYVVKTGYPRPIMSGWPGITANMLPMDATYYDDAHQTLAIFKDDTIYHYDCNQNKISGSDKIGDYYPGIPDKLDGVVRIGGSMLFFKGGQVYQCTSPQILAGPIPSVLPSPMTLTLKITGMCLDLLLWYGITSAAAYETKQPLRLSPCRNDWRQQWVYDNWSQIIMNPATGLCLTVTGNSTDVLAEYSVGSPYQRWRIDSKNSRIIHVMTGWYLYGDPGGASNNSPSNGFIGVRCAQLNVGSIHGDPKFATWSLPFGTDDSDWLHSGIGSAGNDEVMTIASNKTNFDTCGQCIKDPDNFWCENDNKCYKHGSDYGACETDAQTKASGDDTLNCVTNPDNNVGCSYTDCQKAVKCPGGWRFNTKSEDGTKCSSDITIGRGWCSLVTDDSDINQAISEGKGEYCPIKTKPDLTVPGAYSKGSNINSQPGMSSTNPAMNSWAWNDTSGDTPLSLIQSLGWDNLPNQRWIYVPENHSIINPATGYRIAVVGKSDSVGGLQWNSATGIKLQPWVRSAGWNPTGGYGKGELDNIAFLTVLPPYHSDINGVYGKGGCFRWFCDTVPVDGNQTSFLGYAFNIENYGVVPNTAKRTGPLALLANNWSPPLPNGIKPWFVTGYSYCLGEQKTGTSQIPGVPISWTALSTQNPLPGLPLGYSGMGGQSGNLYFVSNVSNQLAIGNTNGTSPDVILKNQNISINSYGEAQQIAKRMGGRVAYEYELKTSCLGQNGSKCMTSGMDNVSGWATTFRNQSSANSGKRYIKTSISFPNGGGINSWKQGSKSQSGVWMVVVGGGQARDQGDRVCSYGTVDLERNGTVWNAQVPVWRTGSWTTGDQVDANKNNRVCDILGGCMSGWNCNAPSYDIIPPSVKLISNKFPGIPQYLNSVFYDNRNLYFCKSDPEHMVYIFKGGSNTTAINQGNGQVSSKRITDIFINFTPMDNLYQKIMDKSENMGNEYTGIEKKDIQRYILNDKILRSGKKALAKSTELLREKNKLYLGRDKNIKSLDSSIQSDQRQSENSEYNYSRLNYYVKYMKYGLTMLLVELIIVLVYRGELISGFNKKITIIVMLSVLAVFGVVIIPLMSNDLRGSKLRWGKVRWGAGKLPEDLDKYPVEHNTGIQTIGNDIRKVKQEIATAKCSKKTMSMTDTTKPILRPTCSK